MALTRRGTYARLLAAILLALALEPLLAHHLGPARWIPLVFMMVVLVAALDAMRADRRTRVQVWVLGAGAFVTAWIAYGVRESGADGREAWVEPLVGGLQHATAAVFLGLVAWMLIRRALAPGRVTGERVTAAICAYLLLGLIWSQGYQFVQSVYGTSLSIGPEATSQDYTYFSFVTLTTLGYGDVLPTHPASRVLAFLEAVTGVLYLATLVARLVALHIAHEGPPDADA